ncbi:MAG: hypothetical protein AW10_01176 [Candidatus Accumulibacter appositus]|uniref:Uncharacterized protein n=1 Tax=Candidatus Accumulibacter appositus TaxID=1454003 RepID=A0A011NFK2_9PROT|nr:MAG: hypothetical protein AW10_01176 [Candidatus Accumulibacter appositus]
MQKSRKRLTKLPSFPFREKGQGKRETVMTFMIWRISTCHDR